MVASHEIGPFFDDLAVGDVIPPLPVVTVTDADNVAYRAITGDQNRLVADAALFYDVSHRSAIVNPGLVMQFSIGQTTNATRRVIANLYYRSVRILRPVLVGQRLATSTTVLGLRDASPKGSLQRGKVWLGVFTESDDGPVATYERCALLPARSSEPLGHDNHIPGPVAPTPLAELASLVPDWDLGFLEPTDWALSEERVDPMRDHIDLAAALARMTFNQASVHRDAGASPSGRRLVYGGHVQAMAQASLTRLLPGFATVVAWDGCDHLGPAHEDDLVEFRHTLVDRQTAGSGELLRFDCHGAVIGEHGTPTDILHWTPVVWAR
jgi:acyl dehydratase